MLARNNRATNDSHQPFTFSLTGIDFQWNQMRFDRSLLVGSHQFTFNLEHTQGNNILSMSLVDLIGIMR